MDPGSVIPDLIRDRGDGRGARTWTPDQARGDGLLKDPGFVRTFSVIPAKAEPAPDSIRGIHVHRDETAEEFPEGDGIFPVTFSRSTWTPGLRPG